MSVEQISIFIENKAGRLAEVLSILAAANINGRAMSLADTSDFGILRLIVSDPEKALIVLKEKGFTVGKNEVVAVEVPDEPGGLANLLRIFSNEGINVEYMYALSELRNNRAVIVFRFEDTAKGKEILKNHLINILDKKEVYGLK